MRRIIIENPLDTLRSLNSSPDIELARNGNQEAFTRLVRNSYDFAYRVAARLTGNHEDAEDVCQETFIRIWRHLEAFDTTMLFSTWMYRIVTNLSLDRVKSRRRRFRWLSPTSDHQDAEGVPDRMNIHQSFETGDLSRIVRELVSALPPTQRLVFALRDLEQMDVGDVASVTGLSVGSVKTNLSYARAHIRKLLVREFGEEEKKR